MKRLPALLLLIIFMGCSRDDPSDSIIGEDQYHQNEEVAENVIVLLEENSTLLSSETDLLNGTYIIKFNNAVPLSIKMVWNCIGCNYRC